MPSDAETLRRSGEAAGHAAHTSGAVLPCQRDAQAESDEPWDLHELEPVADEEPPADDGAAETAPDEPWDLETFDAIPDAET